MKQSMIAACLLLGLSACVSLSDDARGKLQQGMDKLAVEIKQDKQHLCQQLVAKHGWRHTSDGCTKKT